MPGPFAEHVLCVRREDVFPDGAWHGFNPDVVYTTGLVTVKCSLYAVFFAAIIVLAVTAAPAGVPGRFWNARLLRFFGKYSYGMYVFQNLLKPINEALMAVTVEVEDATGTRVTSSRETR